MATPRKYSPARMGRERKREFFAKKKQLKVYGRTLVRAFFAHPVFVSFLPLTCFIFPPSPLLLRVSGFSRGVRAVFKLVFSSAAEITFAIAMFLSSSSTSSTSWCSCTLTACLPLLAPLAPPRSFVRITIISRSAAGPWPINYPRYPRYPRPPSGLLFLHLLFKIQKRVHTAASFCYPFSHPHAPFGLKFQRTL